MGTALTSATEQIAEAFKVARDWSRNSGNQSAGGGLQAEPEPEEWAGLTALVEAAGLDAKAISEQKEIEAETAQAVLGSDELINQLAFEIAAAMQGMVLAGSVIFPPVLPCVVAVYGPPISPIYGGGGITTFIPTLDMMNVAISYAWNTAGYGAAFPTVVPQLPGCKMNISIKGGD